MSFIAPLQPETSIQREEEINSSSQGEIVIYRGRKFNQEDAFLQQIAPTISFTNKMLFNIGRILEVDMGRVTAVLPPAFTKMLGRLDEMFQEMEQPADARVGIWGLFRKQLTLQEEIKKEEEKEKNQLMIYGKLNEAIHQIAVQRQQKLLLAGVSSGKELEEKKKKITEYRALAEERYLQDSAHIEMRKKIDRAMVTSYRGALNQQDEKVIDDYWNYVTTATDGRSKKAQVDARLMGLSVTSLFNEINSMMEKMQSGKQEEKLNPSQLMVKAFNQAALNTYQQLEEEKSQCKSPEEKLLIEYLMLKELPLMATMIKIPLRQNLTARLKEAERNVDFWIEYFKKNQQESIDYCQKYIKEWKENIRQAEEILAASSSSSKVDQQEDNEDHYDEEKWKVRNAKRDIEIDTESIEFQQILEQRLIAEQADKTYFKREAYERMKSFGQETPKEIRACMPIETCFDQQMIECINLEQGIPSQASELETSMCSVSADMRLDLAKLEDPIEYFHQDIIKADQKKLKIFEPKIVVLDENN